MMDNYCDCQSGCKNNKDESRNIYSIDYDALIERLTKSRDEIDSVIHILEHRKAKDNVINNILSQDDDKCSISEEEILLKKILNGENKITNISLPYSYYANKPSKYGWYLPYFF